MLDIEALGGEESLARRLRAQPGGPDTPLLAAARMAAPVVTPRDFDTILAAIEGLPPAKSAVLDDWNAALSPYSAPAEPSRMFELGFQAAQELRRHLGNEGEPIDPEHLLALADVAVHEVQLESKLVDAIAVWSLEHGPGVVVNVAGAHGGTSQGRRATLAHELAHMLLDRGGALPLVEVLGGATAPGIEPRARAFAAELLLPRTAARKACAAAADIPLAHRRLAKRFRASREIVAWQIRNSGVPLSPADCTYLRGFVSNPDRF